ncbi:MAG: hypothetical protein H6706_00795 [Myxococcales bacterium]|nr:hypothetical protein [Myxococcales bacterium]
MAIRDIWPDPDGSLWLATEGAGLVRVRDPRGAPRFAAVGRAQGLPVAGVHRLLPDDQGRLWLSSNQGILLVNRGLLHAVADGRAPRLPVEVFGPRDGLPHAEANGGVQGAELRTRDGRLLFPTQAGVAVVDPARHPVVAPAPTPVIDTVGVGGQARRLHGEPIDRPLGGRDLTFTFTAATSEHPEQVRFSYRLEGYDADWVEAGTRRAAFFTQVPPGRYRLAVRAQAPTGGWSAATLSPQVIVPPRFFEQGWFFALMGLAALGAVALIIRLGLARARAREVALAALVAERTAETVRQAEATCPCDGAARPRPWRPTPRGAEMRYTLATLALLAAAPALAQRHAEEPTGVRICVFELALPEKVTPTMEPPEDPRGPTFQRRPVELAQRSVFAKLRAMGKDPGLR